MTSTYTFGQLPSSPTQVALPFGSWLLYSGTTSGTQVTPVLVTSLAVLTRGSVALTGVATIGPSNGGSLMKRLAAAVRHRPPRADERGLGLVELLVTMVLLVIVGAIVTGLYSSTMRTLSNGQILDGNTRQAANGMNEVSRVIRAATANPVLNQTLSDPALVAASSESVTLYAYVNLASSAQQPMKYQLSLDASRRLVETQWTSYVTAGGYFLFNTTPVSTRIMAGTIATAATGRPFLFTYVLPNGTVLPVPTVGTFTSTQLASIAAVKVTMTLQNNLANTKSAVTLVNTVGMPNLGLSRTGW